LKSCFTLTGCWERQKYFQNSFCKYWIFHGTADPKLCFRKRSKLAFDFFCYSKDPQQSIIVFDTTSVFHFNNPVQRSANEMCFVFWCINLFTPKVTFAGTSHHVTHCGLCLQPMLYEFP
jgi:hypothetical protein